MSINKNYPPVLVTWVDAASYDAWMPTEHFSHLGSVEVHSIGFLLEVNEKEVKLLRSQHTDATMSEGMFTIPAGMVKSIQHFPYKFKKSPSV